MLLPTFFYGPIKGRGYVQLSSPGIRLSDDFIIAISNQPRTAKGKGYTGQYVILAANLAIIFKSWTTLSDQGSQGWCTFGVQVGIRDYAKVDYDPSTILDSLDPTLGETCSPINADEEITPLSKEDLSILSELDTDELVSLISNLLQHSAISTCYAQVTVNKVEPERMVLAILKVLPRSARLMSWTTNKIGPSPPEGEYGLTVYENRRNHVTTKTDYKAFEYASLFHRTAYWLLTGKVKREEYDAIYDELSRLGASFAAISTVREIEAKEVSSEKMFVDLAQDYIKTKLYDRAIKMIQSAKERDVK